VGIHAHLPDRPALTGGAFSFGVVNCRVHFNNSPQSRPIAPIELWKRLRRFPQMTHMSTRLPAPASMEQGLLAWTRAQGPAMWHEIACGIDFADTRATIDLLMAVQWITRQENCCRATALMLLARMVAAGLHDNGPAHLAPEAARVMCQHLHRRLAEGRFPEARYLLTLSQRDLVEALFGAEGPMPLPDAVRASGASLPHPPYAFVGWRPVMAMPALSLAA
jgi:hypothetical protein